MDDTGEQTTLREKAYESFTHHLLARDVRPGQFISQRRLVELTGAAFDFSALNADRLFHLMYTCRYLLSRG